jgi:hypothetical protein
MIYGTKSRVQQHRQLDFQNHADNEGDKNAILELKP